jgi:hypothetical protein
MRKLLAAAQPESYAASLWWKGSLRLAYLVRKLSHLKVFVFIWVLELIACDQWSSIA